LCYHDFIPDESNTAQTESEPEDPERDLDATMVLTRQHNQVRALQEQLEAIPSTRTGLAEGKAVRAAVPKPANT